jgi:N-acetylmuramoyl-L-alanine amidase
MVKLYLRAGHGGRFIGTSGFGLVEKVETLRHILALAQRLSAYEVDMKLARTEDVTLPIADSIAEANAWGADLYYSAHHNGFTDSRAYGYDSHIYTSPQPESVRVQNVLHPRQAAVWLRWGSRDRGKKRSNFAELRETRMASILAENGFMTNPDDARLLANPDFLRELDQATADAFVEMYDLKLKEEPEVRAQTHIVAPGETMYRIARNNNMTLDQLSRLNPHIGDTSRIEVGDIIFLTEPSSFEVEYATMNRDLILCKLRMEELEQTGRDILALAQKFV